MIFKSNTTSTTSKTLNLQNCTFKNCKMPSVSCTGECLTYAGIIFLRGVNITMNNCSFNDCSTISNGGLLCLWCYIWKW
jgi:hypothetical protein